MPVATEETPVAHALGGCIMVLVDVLSATSLFAYVYIGLLWCVGRTEVVRCEAKIHKMSMRVWDSKHDWLYTIFKPFIKSQIRKVGKEKQCGLSSFQRPHTQERERVDEQYRGREGEGSWPDDCLALCLTGGRARGGRQHEGPGDEFGQECDFV